MPTGDRLRAVPTSPAVSPIKTMPTVSLLPWREAARASLLSGAARSPGSPLRLEADHRRPFCHRESHAVEHVDFRNERAGRLLEIRLARPFAGPVGGHSGGREELAEAAAACLEAGPECSQADGDSARQRPPGPIVSLVVAAVRKPGGVADQLEGLTARVPRLLEDLQGHAVAVERHARGVRVDAASAGGSSSISRFSTPVSLSTWPTASESATIRNRPPIWRIWRW